MDWVLNPCKVALGFSVNVDTDPQSKKSRQQSGGCEGEEKKKQTKEKTTKKKRSKIEK